MKKMQKRRKRIQKIYCQPQGEDAARLKPLGEVRLSSCEILMKISVYNAKELLFSSINSSDEQNRKKKIFI